MKGNGKNLLRARQALQPMEEGIGGRKMTHIHRLIEDEEDILYQLCDSSDEVLEEGFTQVSRKHASQGFVRKRQGESKYNINNIVIPMSLAKVEKPQYKDILTPSWRVVDTSSLMNSEAEKEEGNEEGQVEDLTNEVFSLRHLDLEQREKLRWPSWGKRKCCRLPKRSGSRLSGSGGGMCTSGEESSVELSCAQLDTDEQQSSEEWLQPQTPWDPRVFPLGEDEEDALLSDNLEQLSPLVLHSRLVDKARAAHPMAAERAVPYFYITPHAWDKEEKMCHGNLKWDT
ncbi:hypothetical protein PFLUV_G00143610 [Perca fluviatilis]|uniref:PEHE domain-containing protein n=1 Tax=Perca fluviatilis TaxID=8168 RepID=A0A6A5E2E6_PERFL|nr:hypothetical protein PFLUV_G00143610 [Perca fluviatilis]